MTNRAPQPRWEGMDVGENGPVRIVNPIKWCEGCKTPIEAKYTYCLDCFRKLPEEDRSKVCAAQRLTRRLRRKKMRGVRPS